MSPIRRKQLSALLQAEMNHWDSAQRSGSYFACGENFAGAHRKCLKDEKGQIQTLISIGLKSGAFRGQDVEAFFDLDIDGKDWRVLEIGAGYGGYAPIFASRTKEYVGTDVSQYVVVKGNRALGQIPIENASLVWTPDSDLLKVFRKDKFDFIFASGVFIHLPKEITQRYIEQTTKLLLPGGRFLFHFNVLDHPEAEDHFETAYGTKNSHRMRYNRKSYEKLFEKSGLEIWKETEIDVGQKDFHAHFAYGGLAPSVDEKTIVEDDE